MCTRAVLLLAAGIVSLGLGSPASAELHGRDLDGNGLPWQQYPGPAADRAAHGTVLGEPHADPGGRRQPRGRQGDAVLQGPPRTGQR